MLTDLLQWAWAFQENCTKDFDPEPHWMTMIKAWKKDLDPGEVAAALCEGRPVGGLDP